MSGPWHLQVSHPISSTLTISRQRHGVCDECCHDGEKVSKVWQVLQFYEISRMQTWQQPTHFRGVRLIVQTRHRSILKVIANFWSPFSYMSNLDGEFNQLQKPWHLFMLQSVNESGSVTWDGDPVSLDESGAGPKREIFFSFRFFADFLFTSTKADSHVLYPDILGQMRAFQSHDWNP